MKARVTSFRYVEAENRAVQSFRKQDRGYLDRLKADGYNVYHPGGGWAYVSKPAHILLTVAIGRKNEEKDVTVFFRGKWTKFTEKRIEAIRATKPEEVDLTEEGSVSEQSLDAWFAKAQSEQKLATSKKRKEQADLKKILAEGVSINELGAQVRGITLILCREDFYLTVTEYVPPVLSATEKLLFPSASSEKIAFTAIQIRESRDEEGFWEIKATPVNGGRLTEILAIADAIAREKKAHLRRNFETELAKLNPEKYPLISFAKGINPKTGEPQWEARAQGKKYILNRVDAEKYTTSTGAIHTFVQRELVPGRVLLVEKLCVVFSDNSATVYARGSVVVEVAL